MRRTVFNNIISFLGAIVVIVTTFLIVFILAAEWLGLDLNPYVGVIAFLVLPMILGVGVLMIPIGQAWNRRRMARRVGLHPGFPRFVLDLKQPRVRRRVLWMTVLGTLVSVLLIASAYEAVVFMDTTKFCGEVCHSVMAPELASYQHSPHSRVPCVDCHIGEGANWFVKSKLSGMAQVFAVTFDTHARPIPTPVHNLRPARETCEHCHWPQKFHGSKLVVKTHYETDEANSPLKNVLLMKTGGGDAESGIAEGIHWHMNIQNEIRYVAGDSARETILYIKQTTPEGEVTEYVWDDSPLPIEELRRMPNRAMDCMDCHNRPSHVFEVPEVAVDEAMVAGAIPIDLPYIRREGVRILTAEYPSREEATLAIMSNLAAFYAREYPDVAEEREDDIRSSGRVLADIYLRNVFPEMKITWGTYRNNIGHTYFNGCFRCHDEEHTSPGGKTVSQDCESCHQLLAYEEEMPEPVLEDLPTR